ncbi:MAG: lysophospholipid acyltransferase family protein [Deltaproteobacteria bacterium]|nr:lysophospholipid acyltransferase family protein [Deltaproteobacteria bacterium]
MKERLFRAILKIAEAIPLPLRAALFEAVMLVVWAVDARHRRIGRINLRIAFPEMEDRAASRIIRLCYVRMGTSAAEFIHIPKMDARYIAEHFRIEGMEHLQRTEKERGLAALAMTGHFGNWELLAHVYGAVHAPAAFIVRPLKSPVLDRIVTERREWGGNRPIRKVDSAKAVMREIRGKTLVGILIDQNVDTYKGVLVDFFGRKAYTTFGIARLALAMRTAIHAGFIFRDPRRKFHHTLRFGPPLPMDPDAPREEEVLRLTRGCNEQLEMAIREDPTQWLWFHRRWKTRPPGEPDIYETGH